MRRRLSRVQHISDTSPVSRKVERPERQRQWHCIRLGPGTTSHSPGTKVSKSVWPQFARFTAKRHTRVGGRWWMAAREDHSFMLENRKNLVLSTCSIAPPRFTFTVSCRVSLCPPRTRQRKQRTSTGTTNEDSWAGEGRPREIKVTPGSCH